MSKFLMIPAIATVISISSISTSASATELKCGCYAPVESQIAAGNPTSGFNLNCESNDRFTTTGKSVSVQKKYLKVYVNDSNAVQDDEDMSIKFRSRNKQKFHEAYDETDGKSLWSGGAFNENDVNDTTEIKVDGFKISEKNDGTWVTLFRGNANKKVYDGLVLFYDLGDGKKTMTALCLQDD